MEIDINPIAISNGKAYALDARIIVDNKSLDINTLHHHLVISRIQLNISPHGNY